MAGVDLDGVSQGSGGGFEDRFRDVVTVVAVVQDDVQVHQGVRRDRLPEDFHELRVELPDFLRREFEVVDEPVTAAQIEGGCDECVFHRQRHRTVADDSGFVPERLTNRLSQDDAGVFDGVMGIHIQIPVAMDRQIKQAMLGEQCQHVIEEPDAGLDLRLPGAVEVQGQ